jgi:hypothetical protein
MLGYSVLPTPHRKVRHLLVRKQHTLRIPLDSQVDESGDQPLTDHRRLAKSIPKSLMVRFRLSQVIRKINLQFEHSMTTEQIWRTICLLIFGCILLGGCRARQTTARPFIEFTKLPEAGEGGPDKLDIIEGRVTGALSGQQIVLFAKSGAWWIQPITDEPFTMIQPDSTWKNSTHLGTEYAALLVTPEYRPQGILEELPKEGNGVVAVATAQGEKQKSTVTKTLQFSGYEWEVRHLASDRAGTRNNFDPANAWTDERGFLHLRITRNADGWTCAEVKLTRSLGYGSYLFVVRELSHLEPAAVFSIFTREDLGSDPNFREMNIEISRWGDVSSKNGQYVIQPYYVPANVTQFIAPAGVLTHSFRWEPGRVSFRTFRGEVTGKGSAVAAEHIFISGVPSPGGESVRINLFVFGNTNKPLQNETEVIIEKFEYLP